LCCRPPQRNKLSAEKDEKKIVVSIKDDKSQEESNKAPDWAGSSSVVDKLAKVMDTQQKGETAMLLPSTLTMDDIARWIPKVTKSMSKKNLAERHDGRSGLEVWAFPSAYANIEASQGGGGGTESLMGLGERRINVAELIYNEIAIHGRQTITEIVGNIGAIEEPMLVLVINAMWIDKFLKPFKEKDGTETLELLEHAERNRSLGYTDDDKDKPKELVDVESVAKQKEEEKKRRDTTSKTPLFIAVPVIETAEELKDQKEKSQI
jgi:hypothetical protein